MSISESELRNLLEVSFPEAEITIQDLAGDNDHWSTTVICSSFEGKNRIEQHRMVQEAVKEYDIHALQITTKVKAS